METIVGIGSAGCNISEGFRKYKLYDIYKIDSGITNDSFNYGLQDQDTHQGFEEASNNFEMFFANVDTDVMVVVSGGGKASGVTLKVLEQLVKKLGKERVNVLYVQPDIDQISGEAKLYEKLVFNVLQQYARSGMYNNMMLVSNPELESAIGDVPLRGYFDKLNELVVSTIHMINVFEHSEAEMKIKFRKSETSKISTFGIYNLETDEEKLFFPLDNQLEMHYYYAINEKTLESDGNLMQGIKNKMREINNSSQRGTYGVYSTQYDSNYSYLISFSQKVQNNT